MGLTKTNIGENLQKYNQTAILIWDLDLLARTYAILQDRSVPYQLTFPGLIWDIVNPPDRNSEYYGTPLGDAQLKFQSLVAEQFTREILWKNFRLEQISKYPYWASSRRSRELKKEVKAEAKLWVATWGLVSQMHSLGRIVQHPTTVFRLLLNERALICFCLSSHPSTPTDSTKAWRHENSLIRATKQPFCEQRVPIAYKVVEAAQQLAGFSQPFRKDFYNKVWKARVARVKNDGISSRIAVDINGKYSLQGHRPKK